MSISNASCFYVVATICITTLNYPINAADEEITPEVKALISRFTENIKSTSPAVRIAAYKSMGELGPKASSVRRALCVGMLDPFLPIQTAAADALKKIDEPLYKIALAIVIDKNYQEVAAAAKLGMAGEPLTPLVLKLASQNGAAGSFLDQPETTDLERQRNVARQQLAVCVQTLVAIAPEDPAVNTAVINMLANPSQKLRAAAVANVAPLTNKKPALTGVLKLAANLREDGRIREGSVLVVPSLIDEKTAPTAKKALEALRFDTDPKVREAVDMALKQMAK